MWRWLFWGSSRRLQGSLWLALSLSPFIKRGQTSRIVYQMGQLVSLNTWYEAIRHLITWSLGCSWLGALQPSAHVMDWSQGGRQPRCPPLIGFAVLHWTMEQVEAEGRMKKLPCVAGIESLTYSPLHLNTNQSQTTKFEFRPTLGLAIDQKTCAKTLEDLGFLL